MKAPRPALVSRLSFKQLGTERPLHAQQKPQLPTRVRTAQGLPLRGPEPPALFPALPLRASLHLPHSEGHGGHCPWAGLWPGSSHLPAQWRSLSPDAMGCSFFSFSFLPLMSAELHFPLPFSLDCLPGGPALGAPTFPPRSLRNLSALLCPWDARRGC